jgi:hypothetical protein
MGARGKPLAVEDGNDRLARTRFPIGQAPAFARPALCEGQLGHFC